MTEIFQNKKIVFIIIISTVVIIVLGFVWFSSITTNQPKTDNNTLVSQDTTPSILPGANFTAAPQSFLLKPEIEISTELNSFPKVEKNSINESYILNNQPLLDSGNFDKNILTISEEYLNPEYEGESDIPKNGTSRELPKSIIPNFENSEFTGKIFLINDENFNLYNLGYGVVFYKSFKVDNRNFHVVIKTDISSKVYIYAGSDLTKLTELNTNINNPDYFGVNLNYFDNTIVYITATSQNPIEKSDYKEFHINVDELAKKDLSSRIEFKEQIVTPGIDND